MPITMSRRRRISRAWISMSVACAPWMPPLGWWSTIWKWGSDKRLPVVPPARINDAAPRRCRLGGGEIHAEVGDTPQRVRTQAGGGETQLHPGVVRPAALLLHRLPAAELPGQVQVEVGGRELQRGRKRDQLLG